MTLLGLALICAYASAHRRTSGYVKRLLTPSPGMSNDFASGHCLPHRVEGSVWERDRFLLEEGMGIARRKQSGSTI